MVLLFENLLGNALGVIVAVVIFTLAYFKWSYQYWKRRNMPYLKPTIPFGHLQNQFRKTMNDGVALAEIYKEIKAKGLNHCGIYVVTTPVYYPINLEYIKNVMTTHFSYFVNRGIYVNEKDDPIGAHLFALSGEKWKNLRTKLTPTFTTSKMKSMFHVMADCGLILEEVLMDLVKKGEPVNIKYIFLCFTTDIIGSCAFGLDCRTLKGANSGFRKYGKKIFRVGLLRSLELLIGTIYPSTARALGFRQMPKDVSDFFTTVVTDTVNYREKNNVSRKDFIQLLIDMKNNPENATAENKSLTMDELVAHCFVFFFGGFESSSLSLTFALLELATNQEIQDKVRKEIVSVLAKHNNQITYDSLNEMKYMDQILDETLRKYPVVPFLSRVCMKDYKIPDENIILEKGTRIFIPTYGIHHDEEYYPNPTKFDPDRFSEENKKLRHPYAHIPFGKGPMICIAKRLGIMQLKVGLATLLGNFKCTINDKTQTPVKISITSAQLSIEGDLWLNLEKI